MDAHANVSVLPWSDKGAHQAMQLDRPYASVASMLKALPFASTLQMLQFDSHVAVFHHEALHAWHAFWHAHCCTLLCAAHENEFMSHSMVECKSSIKFNTKRNICKTSIRETRVAENAHGRSSDVARERD